MALFVRCWAARCWAAVQTYLAPWFVEPVPEALAGEPEEEACAESAGAAEQLVVGGSVAGAL